MPTVPDIQNGDSDLATLDSFVSGPSSLNGDGYAVTRSGVRLRTLSKLLTDLLAAPPAGWIQAFGHSGLTFNQKGDPGGNVSDVGSFAQFKAMNMAAAQPGCTTVRLTDRTKAVFEKYTGAVDIAATYPNDVDYWWTKIADNTIWLLAETRVTPSHCGGSVIYADNVAYINAALRFAKAFARSVLIPVGLWSYGAAIYNDSVSMVGEGYGSNLQATDYTNSAIFVTGTGPQLCNLRRTYTGDLTRNTNISDESGNGVTVKADRFVVDQVWVEKGRSAGMMFRDATNGSVTGCRVEDTSADAFHTTRASANIAFARCHALRPGDDCFPVVGYVQDNAYPTNISYSQCTAESGQSRGFLVSGGSDVTVSESLAVNCKSGFMAGSDGSSGGTGACTNIKWVNSTTRNCGDNASGYGAIHLNGRAGYDTSLVDIHNVSVFNAVKQGVTAVSGGGRVRKVKISGLRVDTTGTHGVELGGISDVSIVDSEFANTAQSAIFFDAGDLGRVQLRGITMDNINTSNTTTTNTTSGSTNGTDAIHFESGSTFDKITIADVLARLPDGGPTMPRYERLVECPYAGVRASNIEGPGDVALGSPLYSEKEELKAAAATDLPSLLTSLRNAGIIALS